LASRLDAAPEDMETLLRCFGLNGLRRTLAFMLHKRIGILTFLDTYDGEGTPDIERRYDDFIADTIARFNETLRLFHAAAPGEDALEAVLGEILDGLERIQSDGHDYPKTSGFAEDIMDVITANLRRGSSAKWDAAGHPLRVVRKYNLKDLGSFLEILIRFNRYEAGISAHITQRLLGEFRLLERRFLETKKNLSVLDHDDTLIETWRLLRSNITVLNEVSRSYRHILVDEFQDTDSLQVDILRMIAGNSSATLFTVGDPKQSIYRFRGAVVGVFNEFVRKKRRVQEASR
jgi:ATP-dependent exoDNAse (exonuclease V) beta subunit